jgi:hypothetical protein
LYQCKVIFGAIMIFIFFQPYALIFSKFKDEAALKVR